MLESRDLHNLARNLSYRTCSSNWRGVTDVRRDNLADTQDDHFRATLDGNGSVRYVYRNPVCPVAVGNVLKKTSDEAKRNSITSEITLSYEASDGMRLFYEHAGTPSKLVCIYLPDETRISTDREQRWFHVNRLHTILRELDGEPFVAPDGKLWLRGRDGIFRIFPLEQTLTAPKTAPKQAAFHPVPSMSLTSSMPAV